MTALDPLAASGPLAPFAPPAPWPGRARTLGGAPLGDGGSWLAVDVLGGRQALLGSVAPAAGTLAMPAEQVPALPSSGAHGSVSTASPAWLPTVPVAASRPGGAR